MIMRRRNTNDNTKNARFCIISGGVSSWLCSPPLLLQRFCKRLSERVGRTRIQLCAPNLALCLVQTMPLAMPLGWSFRRAVHPAWQTCASRMVEPIMCRKGRALSRRHDPIAVVSSFSCVRQRCTAAPFGGVSEAEAWAAGRRRSSPVDLLSRIVQRAWMRGMRGHPPMTLAVAYACLVALRNRAM